MTMPCVYLLESHLEPDLAREILCIKHNDPEVKELVLNSVVDLNDVAPMRLGYILDENTHVKSLSIWNFNMDVLGLCTGLQNNQ